MKPRRHVMTPWYNPLSLPRIALRVAISAVFGSFADRREQIAAAKPIIAEPLSSHDYSQANQGDGFWLDFVADTGDGWDSTYAVSRLINEKELTLTGEKIPRGGLLLMGGDQVYPTASVQAYEERLLAPWNKACTDAGHANPEASGIGDLYAIPGNHDWYDGLNSFGHVFARRNIATPGMASFDRDGKVIAGRNTPQIRSYWALKLPHGWWLWGTDSQLEGFIDQAQVDFFRFVASEWMEPGSKLILCVGTPSWSYVDPADPKKEFNSLSFLSRLACSAEGKDGRPRGHELKLCLSGDSHHYARFVEDGCQYITAGGGGAFLHPTHHLREEVTFEWDYPPPAKPWKRGDPPVTRSFVLASKGQANAGDGPRTEDDLAVYPPVKKSRALTWRNLAFGYFNPGFLWLFAVLYGVLLWMMRLNANAINEGAELASSNARLVAGELGTAYLASPWPLILTAAIAGSFYYFADEPRRPWLRALIGLLHWAIHAGAVFAAWIAALTFIPAIPSYGVLGTVGLAVFGSVVSATVFGIYLLLSLNLSNRHWNEAFSSLRIADYKCFLRMKIGPEGLTLYPIGLDKVPGGDPGPNELHSHLIEGPIRIN